MKDGFYKKLKISAIREEVKGFKVFSFEEGHGINYKAGQYLTFVRFINGEEIRRSYSIVSSPLLNEPLSVGIKRIPNGFFSRYFTDELQVGDEVTTIGAGGFFVLPGENNLKQLFFFAAGSGITPVYSLIKTALYSHPALHLVLVYSNASLEKAIFFEDLQKISAQFKDRFHIEYLFGNSMDLSRARLYSELLVQLVKTNAVDSLQNILFYTCGPEAYMRMCTYVLQQEGVKPGQIRKENFVIQGKHIIKPMPPDKNTRRVELDYGGEKFELSVEYPDTILRAARKKGISLPYSCEVGRCGSCVAKCLEGKVWHSYNEVLTENELKQGMILTCVAHPVGGNVKLVM